MDVQDLRFYGRPFSDAEGSWPKAVKRRMNRKAMRVVAGHLGSLQRLRFLWRFFLARRRARGIDLTGFRKRGLNNERFINTQLNYLALFVTLQDITNTERAIEIAKDVMEKTAREPLLLCLPPQEDVRATGAPFEVFRQYLRAMPAAACSGGCHEIRISEDTPETFQLDVTWCVWLELARAMRVPEACLPNCYSDDLVFPDYFGDLGIKYKRTQTLAGGGRCCDFRFERSSGGTMNS